MEVDTLTFYFDLEDPFYFHIYETSILSQDRYQGHDYNLKINVARANLYLSEQSTLVLLKLNYPFDSYTLEFISDTNLKEFQRMVRKTEKLQRLKGLASNISKYNLTSGTSVFPAEMKSIYITRWDKRNVKKSAN